MATITLPVYTLNGHYLNTFEIRNLNFAAHILDQGLGARKEWRRTVRSLRFTTAQSDEVNRWDERRDQQRDWTPDYQDPRPMHGIRAGYRRSQEIIAQARMEKREAALAAARAQVGGLIIPDEHDPRL